MAGGRIRWSLAWTTRSDESGSAAGASRQTGSIGQHDVPEASRRNRDAMRRSMPLPASNRASDIPAMQRDSGAGGERHQQLRPARPDGERPSVTDGKIDRGPR